jgi:hypothetical protein
MAATGTGIPRKLVFSSISAVILYRASLKLAAMRYTNARIQAQFPLEIREKLIIKAAGATPNDITSARESISTPNLEEVLENLATMPSRISKNPASIINQAASVTMRFCWMLVRFFAPPEIIMAPKPQARLPIVKIPGSIPLILLTAAFPE